MTRIAKKPSVDTSGPPGQEKLAKLRDVMGRLAWQDELTLPDRLRLIECGFRLVFYREIFDAPGSKQLKELLNRGDGACFSYFEDDKEKG